MESHPILDQSNGVLVHPLDSQQYRFNLPMVMLTMEVFLLQGFTFPLVWILICFAYLFFQALNVYLKGICAYHYQVFWYSVIG